MPPSRIYGRVNHFLSLNRNYRYLLLTSRDYLETLVSKYRNLGAAIDIRHGQLFDFGCRGFTSRCDLNKSTLHNCKGLPLLRGKNTARSWKILNLHHHYASQATATEKKSKKMLYYLTGLVFAMVGCSYAAVPLYRRFCQATGYGGTVQRRESVEEKIARHAKDGRVASREMLM